MELRPGTIVWATVADPDGRNPKSRPLVVVSPLDENGAHDAVAVTSRVDLFQDDCCVRLPWAHGGHPQTKLTKECLARCDWVIYLKPSDVTRLGGVIPQRALRDILARISPTS